MVQVTNTKALLYEIQIAGPNPEHKCNLNYLTSPNRLT